MTDPMTPAAGGKPRTSGLTFIVAATVVAGVAAYVVTWLVPATIGGTRYAVFAVFWSSLYLVVGGLSGIQQEVTRASRPITAGVRPTSRTRDFGLILASVALVVSLGTAPLWVATVFPEGGWALVLPLVVGMTGYVLVATLAGALYGVSQWTAVALLIIVDSLFRLAAISIVLRLTADVVALAWAAALPFGGTLVLVWLSIRKSIVGRSELDVGFGGLTWNVSRTLVASFSSAAMVSGYPLLLGITSPGESARVLATLFLSVMLTRAPLIVFVMALQGYLIVRFRTVGEGYGRLLVSILVAISIAGVILAAAAWWLGPPIFTFLFPDELVVSGGFFSVLVASSALIAMLCVMAPAVLARDDHVTYSVGWLVAALVTIAALVTPFDVLTRVTLSVILGPAAGLIVHGLSQLRSRVGGAGA